MFTSKNNNNEQKFESNISPLPQRQSPPYGGKYSFAPANATFLTRFGGLPIFLAFFMFDMYIICTTLKCCINFRTHLVTTLVTSRINRITNWHDKLSQSVTKGFKKVRIVIMPNHHSHQQVTDSLINQSILIV
ncbi:unnamed protein product [Rotaria sp. Silwood2]|nr:unnamed protein product [Rotaria sp. Silwood2]